MHNSIENHYETDRAGQVTCIMLVGLEELQDGFKQTPSHASTKEATKVTWAMFSHKNGLLLEGDEQLNISKDFFSSKEFFFLVIFNQT